jgi:hypothetical protein
MTPRRRAPNLPPSGVDRYSNAHVVELLERLQRDLDQIKARLS